MECPKCQIDNPEEMNFCVQCGAKLETICPQCNFSNQSEFKFCGKCGCNLSSTPEQPPRDLSFEEKLDKIQRYLPDGLTEKILAQRGKIEGERKQVTVMFCDMEGYTTLSEELDSEEIYSIMDDVYEILIHNVHDYGGTVNELTGDGIMALFGAPIAQEDAPQRAIRSALSIHREMTKFSDRMKIERTTPQLKMRVGIHNGPVVVGSVGNDLRVEFKAIGDTVNLASRIEELAEPGTTYVTEDTFKLTEGLFRFEAMGELDVKGKEESVRTYRVIAPSARRTRFDVNAERGLTPFVGREKELELLLDGYQRTREGRGQAFSIISEAGVGKSRLLYEFRKAVANEDVTFLEGRCLSYSNNMAYHPVIELLKSTFDIRESDGDTAIKNKIIRGLDVMGADEASTLPYLLELLSVKESGIDIISMSPGVRKDRIFEALKRIVLKGSEMRPLIMAVEDLHWSDPSSEEAVKHLFESISGAKVFLIFTYRPEFVHTWGTRSYHNQMNLNRFSNLESLVMVSHLLGTKDIENNLEEMILEKTEGIPFYVEELIKSLKELNIIRKIEGRYCLTTNALGVVVPNTIQDVIMARVDLLPDEAREVLKTGAVIGRELSYDLIKKVAGLSEQELLSHLSVLRDSELLYERGIFPQSTYIFKHSLTQEVVYDSLLIRRKKKLHMEIGNAIEQIHKDNLDEHFRVLSEHYIVSENYEKAAEYCRLAVKKAERIASLSEAIFYAEKRVWCLENMQPTMEIQHEIIDTRATLGLYYLHMTSYVNAKDAVNPVVDTAVKLGYERCISQIYTILGTYAFSVDENFPKAFKYFEDSLKISEKLNDNLSLAMANHWLGIALSFNCEFEKAYYLLENTLRINMAAKNTWGISVVKTNISIFINNAQGRIDLAFMASKEAMSIAEESGDIYSKGLAYISHGMSCYYKGLLEEASELLLKGIDFSEGVNLHYNITAKWFLAETYYDMGKYQKSYDYYTKAISTGDQIRSFPSMINLIRLASARIKVMNKEKDIDLDTLYGYVASNKVKQFEGSMARYIGEILFNIDDRHIPEAEDWLRKGIEADKRNGITFHLGRAHLSYARLLKCKSDISEAKRNLETAMDIFKKCNAEREFKIARKELVSFS